MPGPVRVQPVLHHKASDLLEFHNNKPIILLLYRYYTLKKS